MIVLKKNDSGPDVKRLQRLLNVAGLVPPPRLVEDGQFGDKTLAAVIEFQKMRGLLADGIVGLHTWSALGQKPVASVTPKPAKAKTSWMDVAIGEMGVHEFSQAGKHESRIVEYHKATSLKATDDETPWCSSFVNWVMRQAGYLGTNSAAARSWVAWGSELVKPAYGSVTVIKRKGQKKDAATGSATGFHVAFFDSTSDNHIRLLGGNQGDSVKYSNFNLASYEIVSFRWPG